jgi:cytochrome bd-type quinol oxidase subunit 2
MHKNLKTFSSLLILTSLLILPYFVFAQTNPPSPASNQTSNPPMLNTLITVAGNGGYATAAEDGDLMSIAGLIIQSALGLLGAIFVLIMVIAGYNWMMASGNEQRVEKAQNMIKRAIIGLLITLSSWAIWTFIFDNFIKK